VSVKPSHESARARKLLGSNSTGVSMAHLAQGRRLARAGFGLLIIGAASCGGNTADEPSGAGDAAAGAPGSGGQASASGGAASSSGGVGGTPECPSGCIELCEGGDCSCTCPTTPSCEGFERPALDKSCSADADCFAGIHVADCCGSRVVLGYNDSAAADFDAYEADCVQRALCPCISQPPTLEDGQATSDVDQAVARCISGQCFGSGPVNTGSP
jgi:hypothetical protein